jgi:hypothetical protein
VPSAWGSSGPGFGFGAGSAGRRGLVAHPVRVRHASRGEPTRLLNRVVGPRFRPAFPVISQGSTQLVNFLRKRMGIVAHPRSLAITRLPNTTCSQRDERAEELGVDWLALLTAPESR